MTCPKCHGEMRVYERSGVTIDQCTECRGIFLDRGELEKLFAVEANWNRPPAGGQVPPPIHAPHQQPGYAPPPPPPAYGAPAPHAYPPPAPAYGHRGHYRQAGHHGQPGHHGHYRRRGSFLHNLFD